MRNPRSNRQRKGALAKVLAAALVLAMPLGGCLGETYQKGYIVPEGALEQIPIGASQEQVLIVLGTPSTVATVSGEVFYYISQRAERLAAYMRETLRHLAAQPGEALRGAELGFSDPARVAVANRAPASIGER